MPEAVFSSLYSNSSALTLADFLIIVFSSLILGLCFSLLYRKTEACSRSFAFTLAMLPAVVATVILMVNGSIGAGVAVAGTFSLVRFRSAQGSAKEILSVFIAMAIGLACGMGYPIFAAIFTLILCIVFLFFTKTLFSEANADMLERSLQITVPEDLEYADMFDDIFSRFTSSAKLVRVKTTNLGSLNRLSYDIVLLKEGTEKAMIDELRCRNGNLEINLGLRDERGEL